MFKKLFILLFTISAVATAMQQDQQQILNNKPAITKEKWQAFEADFKCRANNINLTSRPNNEVAVVSLFLSVANEHGIKQEDILNWWIQEAKEIKITNHLEKDFYKLLKK